VLTAGTFVLRYIDRVQMIILEQGIEPGLQLACYPLCCTIPARAIAGGLQVGVRG
jgi:hypothetical protein